MAAAVAEKHLLEGARLFCGKFEILILGLEKKGKAGALAGTSEVAFMVRLGFGEKEVDDSILSAALLV